MTCLTRTLNARFNVDELNRLERKGPLPVTIIIVDLNGLKAVNDELGHAAPGDGLLRRAGEVFDSLIEKPASVSGASAAMNLPCCCPGTDAVVGEAVSGYAEGADRDQQPVLSGNTAQHLGRFSHQRAGRPARTKSSNAPT